VELNVNASQISSRLAVVTGGGRGISRAMVLGLARAGIQVVDTAAREHTEIDSVAEEAFFSLSFHGFKPEKWTRQPT
jgi:NAD(P)-dependent dehydrogenase (short-subunit alcohol dehydrogenase family)